MADHLMSIVYTTPQSWTCKVCHQSETSTDHHASITEAAFNHFYECRKENQQS